MLGEEAHEEDGEDAGNQAEDFGGGWESHDPGADDGGGEVEDGAGDVGFVGRSFWAVGNEGEVFSFFGNEFGELDLDGGVAVLHFGGGEVGEDCEWIWRIGEEGEGGKGIS